MAKKAKKTTLNARQKGAAQKSAPQGSKQQSQRQQKRRSKTSTATQRVAQMKAQKEAALQELEEELEELEGPLDVRQLISVSADGHWPSYDVRRMDVDDAFLVATELDPQINVDFESPITCLGVALDCPEGYKGDRFTVYYSGDSPAVFDESLSQAIPVGEGLTLVALSFDGLVHHVRIDPIEKAGPTGITGFAVVAGRDIDQIRSLLHATLEGAGEKSVKTIDVVMDPEHRDAMKAYTPAQITNEIRARAKLKAKRGAAAIASVDVDFDPQPNAIDPDAPLLEDTVNAIVRELFGVTPSIRTNNLGELSSADLTLCIAQTAISATMERTPWELPEHLQELRKLCFMSVGSAALGLPGEHGFKPTRRSRSFLRLLFSGPWRHGVRDHYTAELLSEANVTNFEVVGTPSLWDLTNNAGVDIPKTQGRRVLFAADEYFHDQKNDVATLKRLGALYNQVALWPRNSPEPVDYAKRLIAAAGIRKNAVVLSPGAESLLSYLAGRGTDYVGPNLEAGIQAIKAGRRTLILTSDDRSSGVVKLAHLPALRRIEVADALEEWILSPHTTKIRIPRKAIQAWKDQFRS